jgi:hypothetical protein
MGSSRPGGSVRARLMIKPVAALATGGLLVAVAVTGTRALGRLEVESRPLLTLPDEAFGTALLAAALLCLPLVMVGMMLRRRARRTEERRELEWLQRLVFLAVLIAAVVVLRELLPTESERNAGADADLGEASGGAAEVLWSGWTGVLAAVLVASAAALLWWRRRMSRSASTAVTTADGDRISDVVQAGRAVLDDGLDNPQAAVVGCYAAMEHVLAVTGDPRGRAETPEELLQRAIGEGRLAPEPGRRLTELFLTARYSSAAVTPDDVDAAREALGSIEAGVPR